MADKLYTVQWAGAGRFAKGETFTEEQGGPWLAKWLRNGSVAEATAGEVKVYQAAQKRAGEGDEGLPLARSAGLATGDADAVSPPVEGDKQAGKK